MKRLVAVCLVASTLVASCNAGKREEAVPRASFGVLFGGQIQERRDIPFELDSTKQTLGFRVDFAEPLAERATVEWRLDRPAPRKAEKRHSGGSSGEEPDTSEKGTLVVSPGETRIEHSIAFRPGDPLGLWNVRVIVSGRVVLDRPFEVYDRAARERAARGDAG